MSSATIPAGPLLVTDAPPSPQPFVCRDPTGGPDAQCYGVNEPPDRRGLALRSPESGTSYCPVAASTRCPPFERWRTARETVLTQRAVEAGVPPRLVTASFETATATDAIMRVRDYCEHELVSGRALVLLGPTGVGKTYAAVCALRAYRARFAPALGQFWFVPALIGALLDPAERADTLDRAKAKRFVVLDDLGAEYAREGGLAEAFLDEIIWEREAQQLATVFTSNLTADQLKTRFSDRILDRLAGPWGSLYAVAGPSLRRAAA